MKTFFVLIVILISIPALPRFAICEDDKIPYPGGETPLVRIKAAPEKFLDKIVIIGGAITISDYYNFGYSSNAFMNLDFQEATTWSNETKGERAYLYLRKGNAKALESLLKFQESHRDSNPAKVARLKVFLPSRNYRNETPWNFLEVVDIQLILPGGKEWGPWLIAKQMADDEDRNRNEKLKMAQEEERLKKEQAQKSAAEEAARWRVWTDSEGKYSTKARFSGVINGKVQLKKENGKMISVQLEQLSKEDRDWIKDRK